jgi:hypothetical protein
MIVSRPFRAPTDSAASIFFIGGHCEEIKPARQKDESLHQRLS